MSSLPVYMWLMIGFDVVAAIALLFWGVYIIFFDKRLRVIMVDPLGNLSLSKKSISDKRFKLGTKVYNVIEACVYRRMNRIPYSIYEENNPAPRQILKGKPEMTAEEFGRLLDTDYHLKLIKVPINVKKIMLGLFILIAVGVVVMLILHFTHVIDLKTMFSSIAPKPAK
jgi:hypothetical protein